MTTDKSKGVDMRDQLKSHVAAVAEGLRHMSVDDAAALIAEVGDGLDVTSYDDSIIAAVLDGLRWGHHAAVRVEMGGGALLRVVLPRGKGITREWPRAGDAEPQIKAAVAATLADTLEAERAKVAAAYEAAAADCARLADLAANAAITGLPEQARQRESMEAAFTKAACRIRALTSADAQAALEKMLSVARVEGWRAGRDAAAKATSSLATNPHCGSAKSRRDLAKTIRDLPEPKEASHD